MIRLVTYSDSSMSISRALCVESARRNGVQDVFEWTREALEQTDFYEQHRDILDEPRGNGLWAWKPYIILDALQRSNEGDIIIYSDAGIEFVNNVNHIVSRMQDDVWLFGNKFRHLDWCKADCWVPILSNDYYGYNGNQAQASALFIRNSDEGRQFIKSWLTLCCIKQYIDDVPSKLPNSDGFQDHRHDQAILTCWALRCNKSLHWWPAMYNAGNFIYEKTGYPESDNYPVMFHHHRRRNDEWNATDDLNKHITSYFKSKYAIAI